MPNSDDNSEGLTFTPSGPRRRQKVRLTSAIRRTQDEASTASASEFSTFASVPASDIVTTPGGRRHRSLVHRIESGQPDVRQKRSTSRMRRQDRPGPPSTANWITSAGWSNATGKLITRFATTWTVPPMPVAEASQLIYLFNGIEPANGQAILQPVLQWGDCGADADGQNRTGPFWTIASWLVGGPEDSAIHTPHIRVDPGDELVGLITLVSQTNQGFSYNCEFQGIEGTTLPTGPISELVWCVQTLEAYELKGNPNLPNPPYDLYSSLEYPPRSVTFGSINITIDGPSPSGSWHVQNLVSVYGEQTIVTKNTSNGGEVEINFQGQAPVYRQLPVASSAANNSALASGLSIDVTMLTSSFSQLQRRGVSYVYGGKADDRSTNRRSNGSLSTPLDTIDGLDCSGFFRYMIYRATSGTCIIPDGSQNQLDWFSSQASAGNVNQVYPYSIVNLSATSPQLFACFIKPHVNGCGDIGHVWFVLKSNGGDAQTLECYGGVGVGSRIWNAIPLLGEVYATFLLGTSVPVP
jgi:hypothetical protein